MGCTDVGCQLISSHSKVVLFFHDPSHNRGRLEDTRGELTISARGNLRLFARLLYLKTNHISLSVALPLPLCCLDHFILFIPLPTATLYIKRYSCIAF